MDGSHQADGLTQEIRQLVLTTAVSPDAPLTEQRLAQRFGVSRTPVRDALRVLEEEGLVERRKKKGIYLRRPSIKEIAEVYELRAVLEGFAGRLAVQNATSEDIKQLGSYAKQFTRSRKREDTANTEQANIAFHSKILDLSGNALLKSIVERFSIVRRAFRLTHEVPPEPAGQTTPYPHEAIVERIAARDAGGAEKLLQRHIRRAKQLLIERALGLDPGIMYPSPNRLE